MDFFIPLAQAQPPPDFIYQAGNQALQFSSVVIVGIGFVVAWFRSLWMKWSLLSFPRKVLLLVFGGVVIPSVVSGTLYFSQPWSQTPSYSASIVTSVLSTSGSVQAINGETLRESLRSEAIRLIDVREDEERAFGFIPGSDQLRMADIFAGAWKNLPKDQPLYFHCATGTRSHDVAEFLAQKGFTTFYLKERLEDLIGQDFPWEGDLPFRDDASAVLKKRIQPEKAFDLWKSGALFVDARSENRQKMNPLSPSRSLPVIDLSTDELKHRLSSFPSSPSVVIFTDSIALSSFSAFLAALKLHDLGYRVEGIIYEPQKFLNLL